MTAPDFPRPAKATRGRRGPRTRRQVMRRRAQLLAQRHGGGR